MKLCECGCGQPTKVATQTNTKNGHTRGQPHRFLRGHSPNRIRADQALPRITERFWAHVVKTETCWLWTGRLGDKGYGLMDARMPGTRRGRPTLAHRVSWWLHTGVYANNLRGESNPLCILHRCDNPRCVRPEHLFAGTITDNNRDAAAKGRFSTPARRAAVRGANNGNSKLTWEDAVEIRRLGSSLSAVAIARRYGVHEDTVCNLLRGKSFRESL